MPQVVRKVARLLNHILHILSPLRSHRAHSNLRFLFFHHLRQFLNLHQDQPQFFKCDFGRDVEQIIRFPIKPASSPIFIIPSLKIFKKELEENNENKKEVEG